MNVQAHKMNSKMKDIIGEIQTIYASVRSNRRVSMMSFFMET